MAEEFKIESKVCDMIKYGYLAIAQFPKSEKYALGADIKKCMDAMLGYCVEVRAKDAKKTSLKYFDIENKKLLAYVRLSHELGFLPPKKYEVWSRMSVEIGKMIGGLAKSLGGQYVKS